MTTNSRRPDNHGTDGVDSHDLRTRTFSALGATSLILALDRLSQILALAILSRLLPPEEAAVAAAAGLTVGAISLVNTFGVPAALIQSRDLTKSMEATARGALLISALISVVVVQMLAPYAGDWFRSSDVTAAVKVVGLTLIFHPFAALAGVILTRRLKARDVVLSDFIGNVAGAGLVAIPLAIHGLGWPALILGSSAQIAIRTLCLCIFARESLAMRFHLREFGDLARRGSGFLTNGVLYQLGLDAPNWIIGRLLPARDLGLFSRANSLMSYPAGFFGVAVERVVFPAVAIVKAEPERLRAGVLDGIRLIAIVGLPLTTALVVLGPDLIRTVLGPAWVGAIVPFKVLCLATYFRLAERLNFTVLRGTGRPYRLAGVQAVSGVLAIVGCYLAARTGLGGIAAAVVAVAAFSYAATTRSAMSAAGVSFKDWLSGQREGAACAVLAAIVLPPLVLLCHRAQLQPPVVLVLCGLGSAVAGGVASWLAPQVFLGPVGIRLVRFAGSRLGLNKRSCGPD